MSTKKTTTKTNYNPERHLIEGAKILINGFETPGKFLAFLTEALYWTSKEGVSEEKGVDQTFFIRNVISEVLQRWIIEDKNLTGIAAALKEINSVAGYEGYNDGMGNILKGFGASISDGYIVKKYLDEYFKGISIMFEVGHYIYNYECEVRSRELKKAA